MTRGAHPVQGALQFYACYKAVTIQTVQTGCGFKPIFFLGKPYFKSLDGDVNLAEEKFNCSFPLHIIICRGCISRLSVLAPLLATSIKLDIKIVRSTALVSNSNRITVRICSDRTVKKFLLSTQRAKEVFGFSSSPKKSIPISNSDIKHN